MTTSSKTLDRKLKDLYYNTKNPSAYTNFKNLYAAAKKAVPKISRKYVKNWYYSQATPMIWRNPNTVKKRNPIIQTKLHFQVQADLLDFNFLKSYNNGFRYILAVICVFSRKVWVEKLASKTADEVSQKVISILDKLPAVGSFQADLGSEFRNAKLKKYFQKRGIGLWVSQNREIKASIVERFFRTFRGRILKYNAANNTKKWINVYKNLALNYNNTIHSAHGYAPSKVNSTNAYLVRLKLYPKLSKKTSVLREGDFVRLLRIREKFEKNTYYYTDKIFKISKVIKRTPRNIYRVYDYTDKEHIAGTFYGKELLKVTPPEN